MGDDSELGGGRGRRSDAGDDGGRTDGGAENDDGRTDAGPGDGEREGGGGGSDRATSVEDALRRVRDPDAGVNVFEAGLVESVEVADGHATVAADLGGFDPEARDRVAAAMVRAARDAEGVEGAHVEPAGGAAAGDRAGGLDDVERVVAVASAKGGVGKSTVAAHLACALADEDAVGLFDADVHGPNAPALLDVAGPVYADDEDRPVPPEVDGLAVMSVGLLESGAPLAWRGAMAHDAVSELAADTAWGRRDLLVVDLPPGTGDVVLTTLQEVPLAGVVVVTTPFHASVADTNRTLALFRENDVPVLGAVLNMATFACPACGEEHDLFGGDRGTAEPPAESPGSRTSGGDHSHGDDVRPGDGHGPAGDRAPREDHAHDGLDSADDPAAALDAPVLASLPFSPALQGTPRPGAVPAPAAEMAAAVRDRLTAVWRLDVPDDAVDVDLRGVPGEQRPDAVRSAFADHSAGERFDLLSDRDPSPVRSLLADLAGVDGFPEFAVERATPEVWHLRVRLPASDDG